MTGRIRLWWCAMVVAAAASGCVVRSGNVNLAFPGRRHLSSDWADHDLEVAGALAVSLDLEFRKMPAGLEIGYGRTEALGFITWEETTEFFVGVHKVWRKRRSDACLQVGAGIVTIDAQIEPTMYTKFSDSSLGGYVHGGVYWRLGDWFNLGLDIRQTTGTSLDFGPGLPSDVDGLQYALLVGGRW